MRGEVEPDRLIAALGDDLWTAATDPLRLRRSFMTGQGRGVLAESSLPPSGNLAVRSEDGAVGDSPSGVLLLGFQETKSSGLGSRVFAAGGAKPRLAARSDHRSFCLVPIQQLPVAVFRWAHGEAVGYSGVLPEKKLEATAGVEGEAFDFQQVHFICARR